MSSRIPARKVVWLGLLAPLVAALMTIGPSVAAAGVASDIGIVSLCAADPDTKQCTNLVLTGDPWHAMFEVINKGAKDVDNWSFDITLYDPLGNQFPVKNQIAGQPLPVGTTLPINWDMPTLDQVGTWYLVVSIQVKDPTNPDLTPENNTAYMQFAVTDFVPTDVSDIGIVSLCASDGGACTNAVLTGSPWSTFFEVINKGEKDVDNWSFDITLASPSGVQIPVKTQIAGPSVPIGTTLPIYWDMPTLDEKGTWSLFVNIQVKDPTNPDLTPENNFATATFTVENPPPASDIGILSVCAADPVDKLCTDVVTAGQPWHALFEVINKGEKDVLNWSFDITLYSPSGVQIPAKTQIAGQPLPVGAGLAINWDMPTLDEKGAWDLEVRIQVKDPTNPDLTPENNAGTATFTVENPPPASDIGIVSLCAADPVDKLCTDVVTAGQPWHALFEVFNKGEKDVDNWSFDIYLTDPLSNFYTVKSQVPGPPLPVGSTLLPINWDMPTLDEKGLWTLQVVAKVKDPTNPDLTPENNFATATFTVENPPPVSDIGIVSLCAADAVNKLCTTVVQTGQPWHALFEVINKGEKDVLNWSFDIYLTDALGNAIPVKTQIAGPPLLVTATPAVINWDMPPFDSMQKGDWNLEVKVTVKEPTNPDLTPENNTATATFTVENPPTVSDIGITALCAADPVDKLCTNVVQTGEPWHALFGVINKGEKDVDNWSFDIVLVDPLGNQIPVKTQIAGQPLPVGAALQINWDMPPFDSSQKGDWTLVVRIQVKDPTNPDLTPENNFATATFTVENPPPVSDIGITALCAAEAVQKLCTQVVPTGEPWHAMFKVVNKGEKDVDNWSFDITLTQSGGTPIPVKQQVSGPPIPVGGGATINWDMPTFDPTQKGTWILEVKVQVKDPTNPDLTPENNQASVTFTVMNPPGKKICDPDIMVNGDFETKGTATLPTDIPGWFGSGWSLGIPPQSGEWAAIDNPADGVGPNGFIAQEFLEKLVIKCFGYHAWSLDNGTTFRATVRYWDGSSDASDFVHPGDGFYYPVNPTYDPAKALRAIEFRIVAGGPSNAIDHVTLTANLGPVEVGDLGITQVYLHHASPNPFSRSAAIRFDLPRAMTADLGVFDLNGRLVKRLVQQELSAGSHSATWDGTDESGRKATAGVYLYRLRAGAFSAARRVVFIN